MNRFIALFRGINIGGRNILPMKDLVMILENLGYENIRTYIQSGNVVFDSKSKIGRKDTAGISREILARKGFEPKVLLLSEEQLQDAVKNNPFATNEGKALHFFFLESRPPNPNFKQLNSLKAGSEKFKLVGEVFYLYAPNGISRSKLAASAEKLIGIPATARNWNTVSKIVSMAEGI